MPGQTAVAPTITMAELLVPPYRRSDQEQGDKPYSLLTTRPALEWMAPGLVIADAAARIRAVYGLRTRDAVHASTAMISEATGMVTNDPAFVRVTKFETLVLEHYL